MLQLCTLGVALVDTDFMTEESKLAAIEAIASGAILGTYDDTRFKAEVSLLIRRLRAL